MENCIFLNKLLSKFKTNALIVNLCVWIFFSYKAKLEKTSTQQLIYTYVVISTQCCTPTFMQN